MTLRKNNAEGGVNGVTPTTANTNSPGTGGSSGDPFDTITFNSQFLFTSGTAAHGSMFYHAADTAASQSPMFRYSGYSATQAAYRFYVRVNSAPTATVQIWTCRPTSGTAASINYTNAGTITLNNSAGTNRKSFTPTVGTWYRLEVQIAIGGTTATGTLNYQIYVGDSLTALDSYASTTDNTSTGANISYFDVGKVTASPTGFSVDFDDIAVNDGTLTPIGLPSTPPTATLSPPVTKGLLVNVDGSTSAGNGGATISSYDYGWGDGTTHGTGSTSTHTYSGSGTYLITLTVTDSNSNTATDTYSVQVLTPAGQGGVGIATPASGWALTPSTGSTFQAILNDADGLSFGQSPTNPTASVQRLPVQKFTWSTGQSVDFAFLVDRIGGTSGTVAVNLIEGASTVRSTVSAQSVATGTGGIAATNIVHGTIPAVDLASVTDFGNLFLELSFTGF